MPDDFRSLAELETRFATEAACRDYLIRWRWPDGFCCPHCGGGKSWRLRSARFECGACGRQTSATAGTIFERTRKPLRLWFRAMWCVTCDRQGASALALQRLLELPSYQTAWTWLHKLRRAMAREDRDPLHGVVEVDTATLWGLADYGEEQRGLIVIAAEVEGKRIGRIRMRPVRSWLPRDLHAFVQQHVAAGSTVRTDDWRGFEGLAQKGYVHEVDSGRRKYSFSRMPRVDWVAARLRRWLVETHAGAIGQAQLGSYLDEFTFRFNERRCKDPGKLFQHLLQQAVTTGISLDKSGQTKRERKLLNPGEDWPRTH